MSQFGMQMPGGMQRRGPSLNVYIGLLLGAVVALAAACITLYIQGGKIGPEGNALGVHPTESGSVKADKIKFGN